MLIMKDRDIRLKEFLAKYVELIEEYKLALGYDTYKWASEVFDVDDKELLRFKKWQEWYLLPWLFEKN